MSEWRMAHYLQVRTDLRGLNDLVMLEWIEVVLDVNWGPLDRPCAKERICNCGRLGK
jgi:hypothetical protein